MQRRHSQTRVNNFRIDVSVHFSVPSSGLNKETLALYSFFLWLLTSYRVSVCFVKLNVLNSKVRVCMSGGANTM